MSEITKKRVTMTSSQLLPPEEEGGPYRNATVTATDYVREDFLDAYVADAKSKWEVVEVSDEYDAGPGGFDGPTLVPAGLPVQNAGMYYPATSGSDREAELIADGDPLTIATEGSDMPVHLTELLAAEG